MQLVHLAKGVVDNSVSYQGCSQVSRELIQALLCVTDERACCSLLLEIMPIYYTVAVPQLSRAAKHIELGKELNQKLVRCTVIERTQTVKGFRLKKLLLSMLESGNNVIQK